MSDTISIFENENRVLSSREIKSLIRYHCDIQSNCFNVSLTRSGIGKGHITILVPSAYYKRVSDWVEMTKEYLPKTRQFARDGSGETCDVLNVSVHAL